MKSLKHERHKPITLEMRLEIDRMIQAKAKRAEIAKRLDMNLGTLYRELKRGFVGTDEWGNMKYDPLVAHENTQEALRNRGRKTSLNIHQQERKRLQTELEQKQKELELLDKKIEQEK
jgi:IS30 family transposase